MNTFLFADPLSRQHLSHLWLPHLLDLKSGLWNLSLCYQRGVGVAQDIVAAHALQQQCRDRENNLQGKRAPLMVNATTANAGVATIPKMQRSSYNSSSIAATSHKDNGNHANNFNDHSNIDAALREAGTQQVQQQQQSMTAQRRLSLSAQNVTPPLPDNTPPNSTRSPPASHRRRESKGIQNEEGKQRSTSKRRKSKGHKHSPADEKERDHSRRSSVKRESGRTSSKNSDRKEEPRAVALNISINGSAADDSGSTSDAGEGSSPPRGRKDSLQLRPTPLAIARVKAAVERRKQLEAAAVSSAADLHLS